MPQTDRDRAIALAGLLQAIQLVSDIAHRGKVNPQDFQVCMASLIKIDAASNEDVYDGIRNLRCGLRLLSEHLGNPTDMEISRYALELLVLERKLSRHPEFLKSIRAGIEATADKLNHFPLTHDNIIASLAEIYSSTISTLAPRIMVKGEPTHLTNPGNVNRIRALLLAGMRAAILWRQSGGGRLTLLFRRKALRLEAQRLLAALDK